MVIILKLGGSIITNKSSKEPVCDYDTLKRLTKEIKEALNRNPQEKLIVVHGAGSFGHTFANEYDIGTSFKNENDFKNKRKGFSITNNWTKKLNSYVCDALIESNIPAIGVQPSSVFITSNKRIIQSNIDLIKKYLDLGLVPVLYGDVVLDMDETINLVVISGDQIINYLSQKLRPNKVILGTDVDGVYTKNPKTHADASLISHLSSLDDLDSQDSTTNIDVTGGMVGKIEELLSLAELGINSQIINANKANLMKNALFGDETIGTIIKID